MAKERSELDVLRAIAKLLAALTPDEFDRAWAYLVKRYGVPKA